eukprot:scaffold11416_cov39-Attheya_sp.AAC.1
MSLVETAKKDSATMTAASKDALTKTAASKDAVTKTAKTGKAIITLTEEVVEEISEYDYVLEFPLVDGEFTKNEQKGIVKEFQKTYNSMYTEMVLLDTELVEAVPEGRNEAFFEAFEKNIVQYTTGPTLPGGIDATLIGTAGSDKKPEEGFFSFIARMTLRGAEKKLKPKFKRKLMKAFQIAYNDMYSHENYIPANMTDMYSNVNYLTANTSLVVDVKRIGQKIKHRKNNTTDIVCKFVGTMYTNFPMEATDVFGEFDFLWGDLPEGTEWRNKKLVLDDLNGLPN